MTLVPHPAYLDLLRSGELASRVETARRLLSPCTVCPLPCPADRLADRTGACRTGRLARVSSYAPHHGEEDVLRGWRGSGTIFFGGCNLRCQYCQNSDISQNKSGREVSAAELAAMMLDLQDCGCHNINLVSPSHVVPQILEALLLAAQWGLALPLVYNTGGYDALDTLCLLSGVIDIYMPDMKYSDPQTALRLSRIPDYPAINRAAIREMHRQVGVLEVSNIGLAVRGLLVRHLVLPEDLAGTTETARFLGEEISRDTFVNLMDQFHPAYKTASSPPLNRRITSREYLRAVEALTSAGLHRGFPS